MSLRHHVVASFRVFPPPTSAAELKFIHLAFQRLSSTLDIFHMEKGPSHLNLYGPTLTVGFSALNQSLTDPFNFNRKVEADPAQASALVSFLSRICALPRYSFVENDAGYFGGVSRVPFKHDLLKHGVKYKGQYKLTESTVDDPFIVLDENFTHSVELIKSMRHNYQKFHKFSSTKVETGEAGVLKAAKRMARNNGS